MLFGFFPRVPRLNSAPMLSLDYIASLAAHFPEALTARVRDFSIQGRPFRFNESPALMGVINLSSDSWYRESVCLSTESALRRASVLAAQGADIIDLGAESTLAHASRADASLQNSKILPVIRESRALGVPISVETYNLDVAKACFEAGAAVLNLTGAERTPDMYRLVRDFDGAVILCYVQGKNVREVADFDFTADPVSLMHDYFAREIEIATRVGLDRIFIDPGMGFYYRNLQDSAVRVRHQMTVFLNTFRLRTLGFPICHALPHAFDYFGEEVRSAEPFFAVLAALGKTSLFRTHEIPKTKAVLETLALFGR